MSRLSREKKRDQNQGAGSAAPRTPAPIDVHVPAPSATPGAGGDTAAGATVGGVPLVPAEGEDIQRAVLNRLHRIALAAGHPILATVHDRRMGYVIPLRMDLDGSSHLTGEPVATGPGGGEPAGPPARPAPSAPSAPPAPPASSAPPVPAAPPAAPGPPVPAAPSASFGPSVPPAPPTGRDRTTRVLRQVEEPGRGPAREPAPTFPPRAVPEPASSPATAPPEKPSEPSEPSEPYRDSAPTFRLRPTPRTAADRREAEGGPVGAHRHEGAGGSPAGTPRGTVTAPTGAFGPPPRMTPAATPARGPGPATPTDPAGAPTRAPARAPEHAHARDTRAPRPALGHDPAPDLVLAAQSGPDLTPTPPRGFDAVAEAVLGDEPVTAPGDGTAPALLAEPMGRINDAVREGRTEEAARLAADTVAGASAALGPEHPEVLRLQELTAYIAYLAGEPYRALRLSLDLVGVHRRRGDAEAAYGNVQSAATAWRAVRDPARGLELGRELIDLWTALAAEGGPAAEELEQLESVRSRMNRLTERRERGEHG